MLNYIAKRMVLLIPVILGATFIVFTIMDMTPGNPALSKLGVDATQEQIEELEEEMGLHDPFLVRYGRFVWDLLHGDLGKSYKNDLDVMEQIMQRMPYTFLLAFAALVFAIVVGIPAGIISARKQYTIFDNCTMVLTLIGASAPHFWLGLMGVIIFSVSLGWVPAAYSASTPLALSMILPMLTLGMNSTALVTRMTRSAMLDVMNQDYIDTARAKGVAEQAVVFCHMLKNALIPIITVLGLQFGSLLGGAVTTETIFAWPGIGRYIVESISNKDTPCVLGAVVMLAVIVTVINLLVDIIYAFVDPRIKSQYKTMVRRAAKHG
jgi:peptide/nickel transport system permease protein